MVCVRSTVTLAGVSVLALAAGSRAELPLTRVAETGVEGEFGPGLEAGTVYAHVGIPVVDAAGNVVFYADLAGPSVTAGSDSAVFAGPPTAMSVAIREGDPSPANGQPILQLAPNPNAGAGDVLATDFLDYMVRASGVTSELLRIGSQAVDAPAGVLYNTVVRTLASDMGLYAFTASLTGVVTQANNMGVFTGAPGALEMVVRKGDVAPDTGGDTFGEFTSLGIAPDGVLGLHALLADGGEGTWYGDTSGLTLIVRDGSTAPGMPPGTVFVAFDQAPSIASNGAVAFKGFTVGPVNGSENEGLWIGPDNMLSLTLREGSQAPGLPADVRIGSHFVDNNTPQINDAGMFVYRSRLIGVSVTPDNDRAIFAGPPVSPMLIAREGDVAPDTGGATFASIFEPTLNQAGDIAFLSQIEGAGVSGDTDFALYVWNDNAGLRLVARDTNTVVFGVGDSRTIVDIDFVGGVRGSSGLATGLGDDGVIAFRASVLPLGDAIVTARAPGSDPADFNGDGIVDGMDLAYFLASWGPCAGACPADFNDDNIVDGMDLALLLASWT